MCISWLENLVGIIATNDFEQNNTDIQQLLYENSKEVLDHILDITAYEKFIDMLKDNTEETIANKQLMDRTMGQFKGQQNMSAILIDSLKNDLVQTERVLDRAKSKPNMAQWLSYDPQSQFLMMFRHCGHAVPVAQGIKERKLVACHVCLNICQNAAFQKVLDEDNKDPIPRSDQFIFGVVIDYLANRKTRARNHGKECRQHR